MAAIRLTKGQFAIVDNELFDFLNQWKWHVTNEGYAARSEWIKGGKGKKKLILMHRQIMNSEKLIDHINQDKLDNRKENLRLASKKDNVANAKLWSTNKSGYRGIYWSKQSKKWRVRIARDPKAINIGEYKNIEDAVIARNKAYRDYFGEYFTERMVI